MTKKATNLAVLKTGGKQYLVAEGDKIKVEKLPIEEGKKVVFKEVLMTTKDDTVTTGTPFVKGASVEGKVIAHARHSKVMGVKMKAKKRYRRLFGHKQHYTHVEVTKIAS